MRSQDWFPTVQLVLQADWQVLLHSPHAVIFLFMGLAIVLIMAEISSGDMIGAATAPRLPARASAAHLPTCIHYIPAPGKMQVIFLFSPLYLRIFAPPRTSVPAHIQKNPPAAFAAGEYPFFSIRRHSAFCSSAGFSAGASAGSSDVSAFSPDLSSSSANTGSSAVSAVPSSLPFLDFSSFLGASSGFASV